MLNLGGGFFVQEAKGIRFWQFRVELVENLLLEARSDELNSIIRYKKNLDFIVVLKAGQYVLIIKINFITLSQLHISLPTEHLYL